MKRKVRIEFTKKWWTHEIGQRIAVAPWIAKTLIRDGYAKLVF